MSCACTIRLAVLARSSYTMCSAYYKVGVGVVRVGDVSDFFLRRWHHVLSQRPMLSTPRVLYLEG